MAILESKSFGFETVSPCVDFLTLVWLLTTCRRVFLCGGKTEPFEYQTCVLAFIEGVRKEKTNKKSQNSTSLLNRNSDWCGKTNKYFFLSLYSFLPKMFPWLFGNKINLEFCLCVCMCLATLTWRWDTRKKLSLSRSLNVT